MIRLSLLVLGTLTACFALASAAGFVAACYGPALRFPMFAVQVVALVVAFCAVAAKVSR